MTSGWTVFNEVYPPREDSQLMVEVLKQQDFAGKSVLDMGTGTGILAHVALHQGAESVVAADVNPQALRNAMENLEHSSAEDAVNRAVFVETDLFQRIKRDFDVILFNPPYVPGDEELGTDGEKSWAGGENGREVIDRFLDDFTGYLTETGEVFLLQSSLNDVDRTLERFNDQDFTAEVVAEEKIPWERLVVIHAQV